MRPLTLAIDLWILLTSSAVVAAQTATGATTTNGAATTNSTGASASAVTSTARSTTATKQTVAPAPLTTILTPPPSCASQGFTYYTTSGSTSLYWRNAYIGPNALTASCYPASFRAFVHSSGYYSPGVCPSGWYAAEVIHTINAPAWTSWCCPSTMTFDGSACVTTVSTSTSIFIAAGTQRPISGTWLAFDWPVRVLWETSDLTQFTPASAPILKAVNTAGSTRTSQGTNTNTNFPDTDTSTSTATPDSQQGLSGGAIGGIVVGVLAGIALILGAVWFLLRRRRQGGVPRYGAVVNSSEHDQDNGTVMSGGDARHELPAGTVHQELGANEKLTRAELHGGDVAELGAKVNNEPVELDSGQYDLRANGRQAVNGT